MFKPLLCVLSIGLFAGCAAAQNVDDMIPFVLPHQFPADSRIDVSAMMSQPIARVHVGDGGRLYAGENRIRFLGVNITAGSAFPSAADARITADRLTHLGVNCVRFHHLEAPWVPDNITTGEKGTSRKLNPQTLDRLDRFISELKNKGIYVNMNLLVSRTFFPADGLPPEIARVDWKRQHVIGFWYQPIIDLQKEYARNLLTHRNPYTQMTYCDDPVVAVIEVNNENGLIQAWMSNQIDSLPAVFADDLKRQWNAWLSKRYSDTAALSAAWGAKNEPLGNEMLANAAFDNDAANWFFERHDTAVADLQIEKDGYQGHSVARIHVTQPGSANWHVQFNQSGLSVKRGQLYTISFAAKSGKNRKINVGLGQAHEPWNNLGFETDVALTDRWQRFSFTFIASADDANARINYSNLSQKDAVFYISDVSLKPGGNIGLAADQKLEDRSISIVPHQSANPISDACRADWLQFLHDTEQAYWLTMRDYVKKDLGAKALMVGTIVGCSTPNLMDAFDIIDSHAYWQHPHFPGRDWDSSNWEIKKSSMVDHPGSIIPGLAAKRIKGKPFFVTEFNCGQPNPYGAEGVLLLPAYGAMQDWDGIFFFDYGTVPNTRINGYFDISGFPTKLTNLPIAAAMFRRGDLQIAKDDINVPYSPDREMNILAHSWAWGLGDAERAGLPGVAALLHRVSLTTGEGAKGLSMPAFTKPAENKYESDTSELMWDATKADQGLVTINTPRTVAVIGHVDFNQVVPLGHVRFRFVDKPGWVTAAVTLIEGESLAKNPKRAILVITGNVANKGMKLRDLGGGRITCDNNWGAGPTVISPVKASVEIVSTAGDITLFPLNADGQRGQAILGLTKRLGDCQFSIAEPTLWYEIVWQ